MFTASQDRYGSIVIKKHNNIMKYLQYENDITWFFDQLNNDQKYMINNGFEIDITNNELLEIIDNEDN